MLRKQADAVPELPVGARLMVPVMAATGGVDAPQSRDSSAPGWP